MTSATSSRPRLGLVLVGLFLASWPLAAGDNKPVLSKEASASEARILKDISYLAGDECEGRGITTKGIQLAADHIAGVFKENGLKPGGTDGYFQPFEVGGRGVSLASGNTLTIAGPQGAKSQFAVGQQFITLGRAASGTASGKVVFAGYGFTNADTAKGPAYDDFDGLDVDGKIVMVLRGLPRGSNPKAEPNFGGASAPTASLGAKILAAQKKKAAAVLVVNNQTSGGEGDSLVAVNYPLGTSEVISIPVIQIRRSVANQMLASQDKNLKQIEQEIDRDLKPQSRALADWTCDLTTNIAKGATPCKNVIGVLEGSGPLADETVVIGAHYDHLGFGGFGSMTPNVTTIHYGADDNASGTVSVLELARRFGQMENRVGRRLVFMTFSGEESGLLGSMHYANHPVFPLDKTVAMVNMDMVGRYREDVTLQVMGIGTAKDDLFKKLVEKANEKPNLKMTLSNGGEFFARSDQFSFYAKNVPVIFFFTGIHPEYHKPLDKVATINIKGIRQVCDIVDPLIAQLSVQDPKPEFVKIAGAGGGAPTRRGPSIGIMMDYAESTTGVRIESVRPNQLAEKAGLKKDDVIVEVSGKPVKNATSYTAVMAGFKYGDTVDIVVKRGDEKKTFKIKLEQPPQP